MCSQYHVLGERGAESSNLLIVCVYNCLATDVFVGKFLTVQGLGERVSHGQINQIHINWGALDHAYRVPQILSCNYYVCVCV